MFRSRVEGFLCVPPVSRLITEIYIDLRRNLTHLESATFHRDTFIIPADGNNRLFNDGTRICQNSLPK